MASIFEPYKEWILENKDNYGSYQEFMEALKLYSGLEFGYGAIRSYFQRTLKIPFNFGIATRFSEEEKNFILSYYPDHGPTRTTEMIRELFGIDRLVSTVSACAYKMNCHMNDSALYLDKVDRIKKVHKGRSRELGYIKTEINKDGKVCARIKTEKGWVSAAKAVWEQNYGKIPKGYQVIYLDGDSLNLDLDNLYLVSYKVKYQVICNDHYAVHDKEITKSLIKYYELRNALGLDHVTWRNMVKKFENMCGKELIDAT